MIVVLNVFKGDVALAERNLSWCLKMEPAGTPHFSLIAAEEGTPTDKLLDLASKYFSQVTLWTYSACPGKTDWPRGANFAWQSVARHMAELKHPDSWLWLEADVVSLVPGWLSTLEAEHRFGNKPFMGRIGDNGMGGVAIYPPNLMEYTMDALLVRASPWDATLWKDIKEKTHAANHLMAHFPRYSKIRVTVKDPEVPTQLKKQGYVIFHGCNDGSLVTLLEGGVPNVPNVKGQIVRTYEVSDISEHHDGSEAMWQYDAIEISKFGYSSLPYAQCTVPVPSVVTQAHEKGWKAGFFALPHGPSEVHFNAGLVREKDLLLITRAWKRNPVGTWKSSLVRWKLDADLYPSEPLDINFVPRIPQATYEDPRVTFLEGRFWVSYCVWLQGRLFRSHQGFSSFNSAWQHVWTLNVPYGGNGWNTGSGTGHEKNWIWFKHDGFWHFVYQAHPHIVVRVDSQSQLRDYKPPNAPETSPWLYGAIHGGTPPIRVGNEYITFFHSSLAWKGRKKRYYCGAYAFSAKTPFPMTRLTRKPLLMGSEDDPRTLGGPLVTFPCGSLLENNEWLISMGVNDETVAYVYVPHGTIDKLLEKV